MRLQEESLLPAQRDPAIVDAPRDGRTHPSLRFTTRPWSAIGCSVAVVAVDGAVHLRRSVQTARDREKKGILFDHPCFDGDKKIAPLGLASSRDSGKRLAAKSGKSSWPTFNKCVPSPLKKTNGNISSRMDIGDETKRGIR